MREILINRSQGEIKFTPFKYVLYIGRIIHEKNIIPVGGWISSMVEIEGDVTLALAGLGSAYNEFANRYASCENIKFLGHVTEEEKSTLLENCLALVNLSLLESFSLTLMEAWSQGRPVIVNSNCAATRYHVEQSRGGFAVRSEAQFATAVMKLLNDPELARNMGACGNEYVTTRFSSEAVNRRLMTAISAVANEG